MLEHLRAVSKSLWLGLYDSLTADWIPVSRLEGKGNALRDCSVKAVIHYQNR